MTQEHPITPPPELVMQWIMEATEPSYVPTQAARWGADQELDACCEYLYRNFAVPSKQLSDHRRPKPPSLKEEAMDTLHLIRDHLPADMYEKSFLIRRALEALPD